MKVSPVATPLSRSGAEDQLRSLLCEYYPAALDAFAGWANGLCRPEARELLKLAPTPSQAARLTRARLRSALERAGRSRGIEAEADRLREFFRGDYASQPRLIEDALGKQAFALLRQLEAACLAADELAEAVEESSVQHLGDPAAVTAVVDALGTAIHHDQHGITRSALKALAAFGRAAAGARDTIRSLTTAGDAHSRPAAVTALWAVGGDLAEVMPLLLGLLDDRITFRIDDAADLLGEIGPPASAALPRLRNLLTHDMGAGALRGGALGDRRRGGGTVRLERPAAVHGQEPRDGQPRRRLPGPHGPSRSTGTAPAPRAAGPAPARRQVPEHRPRRGTPAGRPYPHRPPRHSRRVRHPRRRLTHLTPP